MSVVQAREARVLVLDDDANCYEQIARQLPPQCGFVVGWRRSLFLADVADEELERTDVVITDSDKQDGATLAQAVSAVRSRFPALKFLLLGSSGDDGDQTLMILLESGARGYLDLNTSADKLAAAVRQLVSGGTWLPPHILGRYQDLISTIDFLPLSRALDDPLSALTSREQRVLLLIACGRSDKEIARTLGVDESTITACLNQLMHRTGACTRPILVALYLYYNLFRSEAGSAAETVH
jgi:DNA-binding NarL/FixJ family response regulator